MPACCPSPPAASRHTGVGSAALGPLNSVPERGISLQVHLGNSGKQNRVHLGPAHHPTVVTVCLYTWQCHCSQLPCPSSPPNQPPDVHKHPPSPSGTGSVPATIPNPTGPDWQNSCAGVPPTSVRACQRQNPSLDDPEWRFQLCCPGVSSRARCPAECSLRMVREVCDDSLY